MTLLKRLILDVLKPRQPNALEFAKMVLQGQNQCRVRLKVEEVDDITETLWLELEGADINYDKLEEIVSTLGGSIHSIDEVECESSVADEK